jgi:hypothetical protein
MSACKERVDLYRYSPSVGFMDFSGPNLTVLEFTLLYKEGDLPVIANTGKEGKKGKKMIESA